MSGDCPQTWLEWTRLWVKKRCQFVHRAWRGCGTPGKLVTTEASELKKSLLGASGAACAEPRQLSGGRT
jgi:hypothetical protein